MHTTILCLLACCLLTTPLKAQEELFYDFVMPPPGVEIASDVEMPLPDVEIASDGEMPSPDAEITAPDVNVNAYEEIIPIKNVLVDNSYAGCGYFDCRRSYCVAASVVIGVALFVGMVALIVNESNHAHQAH